MNSILQHSVRSSLAGEQSLGISKRASPADDPGWYGDIRLRYTDFQVNEIGPDGLVVHLRDCSVPKTNITSSNTTSTATAATTTSIDTNRENKTSGDDGRPSPVSIPVPSSPASVPVSVSVPIPAPATTATAAPGLEAVDLGKDDEKTKRVTEHEHEDPGVSREAACREVSGEGERGETEVEADLSVQDASRLEDLMSKQAASELIQLYRASLASDGSSTRKKSHLVKIGVISDKLIRSKIHQTIRTIFHSRIDTCTDANGAIQATVLSNMARTGSGGRGNNNSSGGRGRQRMAQVNGWPRGEYLHFTLFKENRDTMDAVQHLSRLLKLKPSNVGSAGTKDRRASTAQRCSVRLLRPEALARTNGRVYGVMLGDFEYQREPVVLGSHRGNEFVITVKNCRALAVDQSAMSTADRLEDMGARVEAALRNTTSYGFINYFGHQRFGTHITGTHDVGKLILRGEFEAAVKAILSHDATMPDHDEPPRDGTTRDYYYRNKACILFANGKSSEAVRVMPRRYSAETSVIAHLSKPGKQRDFVTAVSVITRGLRNMYLHAYQSLVWNYAASRRWELYGSQVVAGDLVLEDPTPRAAVQAPATPVAVNDSAAAPGAAAPPPPPPLADYDPAFADELDRDFSPLRARPLSAEEAASGAYTIWDVVLPCPGHGIVYPCNEVGAFYDEFMGRPENGELDPRAMHRSRREFSLSGTYRKLVGRFMTEPSWEVRAYARDDEQLRDTDRDAIRRKTADAGSGGKRGRSGDDDARNGGGFKKTRLNGGDTGETQARHDQVGDADMDANGVEEIRTGEAIAVARAELADILPSVGLSTVNKGRGEDKEDGKEDGDDKKEDGKDKGGRNQQEKADKIAVILTFQLPTSAYATVVLRELMGTPPEEESRSEGNEGI